MEEFYPVNGSRLVLASVLIAPAARLRKSHASHGFYHLGIGSFRHQSERALIQGVYIVVHQQLWGEVCP